MKGFKKIMNNIKSKVPVRFFRNNEVKFENNALEELERLLLLSETINKLKNYDTNFFADKNAELVEVAITPDFHKGSGIPIGTVMLTQGLVVPQAIGNDVNCGMRLYTTNITEDRVKKPAVNLLCYFNKRSQIRFQFTIVPFIPIIKLL